MSQPAPQPSWKQEVNQRLAAHRRRKGASDDDHGQPQEPQTQLHGRAARAAARVAERYAKAPSYSEMQASEAISALRTAEAATRAALEAQAAAQMVLQGLEAESQAREAELVEPCEVMEMPPSDPVQTDTDQVPVVSAADQEMEIQWDPELPQPTAEAPPATPMGEQKSFGSAEDGWWDSVEAPGQPAAEEAIETVEPEQPIHANLIEFPRELVATRRMRPRLTNASRTAIGDLFGQLSIFEVDPSTISTQPDAPEPTVETPGEPEEWSGPQWSGIELDEQPQAEEETFEESQAAAPAMEQAPVVRRLLAGVVDAAMMLGLVAAAGFGVADHLAQPVTMKTAELGALGALIVIGVLYEAFFLGLMRSTPGMMYARISLSTFDGEVPSNAQVRGRLGALMLSLLPVGLGVMWMVFDDDRLTWHDRLSKTFQRAD